MKVKNQDQGRSPQRVRSIKARQSHRLTSGVKAEANVARLVAALLRCVSASSAPRRFIASSEILTRPDNGALVYLLDDDGSSNKNRSARRDRVRREFGSTSSAVSVPKAH